MSKTMAEQRGEESMGRDASSEGQMSLADDLLWGARTIADMANRGQDRLALAAALDIRLESGRAVEIAREIVAEADA
jgi:hypothetical protein